MKRLSDALDQTLDDGSVQKRLADLGGTIPGKDERNPAKFARRGAAKSTEIQPPAGRRKFDQIQPQQSLPRLPSRSPCMRLAPSIG